MEDPNNPYARHGATIDTTNPFASPLAEELPGQRPPSEGTLNPWISMWTQPRATIRQIVATNPRHQVLLVAALGSAGQLPQQEEIPTDADAAYLLGIVVGQAIMGAVIGIIALFVLGWLIKVVAHWFGGIGNTLHTRAAFAWSSVPAIWYLPVIWALNVWWALDPPNPAAGPTPMGAVFLLAGFIALVLAIWELVLLSLTVAEVHQIHGGLGFAAVFVAGLIAFVGLLLLIMPFVVLAIVFAA
jgi:hypothetical protein